MVWEKKAWGGQKLGGDHISMHMAKRTILSAHLLHESRDREGCIRVGSMT